MTTCALVRSVRDGWRRFRAAEHGNVAITFSLALIPLAGMVGAAVDYTRAREIRTKLDAAADSAALAAVDKSTLSQTASAARTLALNVFNGNASAVKNASIGTVSAKVTDGSNGRTAIVNYTATVSTDFMGIPGINSMTVGGSSTAASGLATYMDFYLLLDNTPSMGVGATPSDVTMMVNNTPDKCAFACHDLSTSPNDYYSLAKSLGVTMRIDVVRSATQQLMDTASGIEAVADQFRMAIYTFGSSASNPTLTNIFSLSSDLSGAKTAANNIDLMTVPYQNYNNDQDTDYDGVLAAMNKKVPTPGDGTTAANAQKVLFFVSDGVADASYPSSCTQPTTNGRCQEPLTVADCTALKNRGIKIAVLYTTYLALPTNNWYMTWINPFNPGPYGPSVNSQIAQNMQSCASPGLYFEVSPTQGIAQAMTALFQKAVLTARLTK